MRVSSINSRHLILLSALVSVVASAQSNPASGVTLAQAFAAAVERTETVAIEEARVRRQEARVNIARGQLFPTISLDAAHTRQDTSTAATSRAKTSTISVGVTQPLFDGRIGSGLDSAKASRTAQERARDSRRVELYAEVARRFFGVQSAEREIRNLRAILGLARDRITELKKRNKIGRSRVSETLTSQSQLAVLDAQLTLALGQEEAARDQFARVTGLPRETTLLGEPEMPGTGGAIDDYLQLARKRPDVEALSAALEAARENVGVARAGHLPTLDASGNYYLLRKGSSEGNDWDATLGFSLPIFAGGAVSASVREASALATEAELALAQQVRTAETEIRSAYHNLSSSLEQVKLLEDAVALTERSYREQNREYGFSLVTNIDVIQALNLFQDAKRTLDRARFQALIARAELESAVGRAP